MSALPDRLQAAVGDTYRIERELGGGGMSRVFLAEETRLGRKVVIKVLPPEMGAGVNVERFEREIRLAAKLQHPHVVPLLTAGSHDDLLYYVMPYIEGESLRAKLAREGELPVREAVAILKEVLDALAYAHQQGVVHRDIKPDNVLLSGKHAVVTDFGVAKAVSASTGESSLTSLGVALGTPAYMSPEQAAANPHVDHRADIYAVGAMAYEMLCGQPPFAGPNPQAILAAHVTDAPDPTTSRRAAVPAALNELVMRCLEKLPADRWQRADEVIPHLDAMVTPTGGMTPTGTQPVPAVALEAIQRQTNPWRVAGLFTLASIGALAIVYLLVLQLGLPYWVVYGAVALLAIGLPIMLLTGHHERQRAVARTTGMMAATPPGGMRRLFTWRRAIMGGGLAFVALTLVAGVYMAMRLMGIGPVGTLVASGVLEERGRLILADFEDRTPDSALGTSVTEAFRIDLAQSPMIRLMDASAIAEVLGRMNRDPGTAVDAELAREIAEREGVKAIVAGDIGMLGRGYVVSAQLVSSADGGVLVALRETADDDGEIIAAVDRLSAKLRERIGESFKSVRASEPLDRVTTGSLEALRVYSRALRADDAGDLEGGIALLEEAITLDSTFAMAHRKLAVLLTNSFAPRSQINAAATMAFQLRERLPAIERNLAAAYYYAYVEYDQAKEAAAYRSALEVNPDETTALNNLSIILQVQRRYDEAEELLRRAVELDPTGSTFTFNLAWTQHAGGKIDAARQSINRYAETVPGNPYALFLKSWLASAEHDYDLADSYVDSVAATQGASLTWRSFVSGTRAVHAESRGQLGRAEQQLRENMSVEEEAGDQGAYLQSAAEIARLYATYRDAPREAVRILGEALERHPFDEMEPTDRPYATLTRLYVAAGNVQEARRLLAEYELEVPEGVWRGDPFKHAAAGDVALAEGRVEDALAAYRAWYDEGGCTNCALLELGRAYEMAGQPDSALAMYDRAAEAPGLTRIYDEYDTVAQTYKRLGELYEERGDAVQAVDYYNRFVDLWENADQELQPVVRDVRARIARLVGET